MPTHRTSVLLSWGWGGGVGGLASVGHLPCPHLFITIFFLGPSLLIGFLCSPYEHCTLQSIPIFFLSFHFILVSPTSLTKLVMFRFGYRILRRFLKFASFLFLYAVASAEKNFGGEQVHQGQAFKGGRRLWVLGRRFQEAENFSKISAKAIGKLQL